SVAYGRFRLEARVCALPGDRYVIRSYSPIVTIGGGTVLDISPPRFKRKGDALLEHLRLLERGTAAQVVEEHLRRAGAAGLRAATPEAEGLVRSERDQMRLASHEIRLTPDQQRVVDGLEADFRRAGAAPPSPEEALGRLGVKGTEKHQLFQLLIADRRLVRV